MGKLKIKLPDPLMNSDEKWPPRIRILSDRGIRQGVKQGYIVITPSLDLENPGERLQPASLDLRFNNVDSYFGPGTAEGDYNCEEDSKLRSEKVSWVSFIDDIRFANHITPQSMPFFDHFMEGRSSFNRLGPIMEQKSPDSAFFLPLETTIFNSSPNDINLVNGERIAQAFISVNPFAETYMVFFDEGSQPPLHKKWDGIRALDMGVQVRQESELVNLAKADLMKVERDRGRKLLSWEGLILLHAKSASRMKKIEGGINFAERKQYSEADLLEHVDIRKKYEIKEGEHLVVEVEESFSLSPHTGISVLNNLEGKNVPGAPELFAFSPMDSYHKPDSFRLGQVNLHLLNKRTSWIDPGYQGMMTGFPKLLGKSVQVGDIVGYGQVFYFPNGVERPYGSKELGSQYQGQKNFQLAGK